MGALGQPVELLMFKLALEKVLKCFFVVVFLFFCLLFFFFLFFFFFFFFFFSNEIFMAGDLLV